MIPLLIGFVILFLLGGSEKGCTDFIGVPRPCEPGEEPLPPSPFPDDPDWIPKELE